ncbi:MAG: glycosyltransferase family 39 protein, partial [Actinobacteria bacterium]|nr:glycosyltransferase family 39 protein [Actinomycetota bacterium]MCG2806948.1 glycosyltransferase family 39 protein [Coriobacteriia bacterium]
MLSEPTQRRAGGLLVALLVALVAGLLVAWRVAIAVKVGPGWDTYAFLANAAEFAGKGFGYTEPHRPPLLPYLTSVVFRFAPLSEAAIQWIDGALTVSGVLALYLLMRRRFEAPLALAGALALLAVTPLWQYTGLGYTDTASVALSAWALLAAIAATERHPAWYLGAGSLFAAAALMRFTALLIGFALAVWVLSRWRPFRTAKWILGGVAAAVVAYLPAATYYQDRFGEPLFPFVFAFGITETITAPGGEGSVADRALFYLRELPGLVGPAGVSWFILIAMLVSASGIYVGSIAHLSSRRPRPRPLALAAVTSALAVYAQFGGGLVARQVTIPVAVVFVWRALAPLDGEYDGPGVRVSARPLLDATMLAWFLAYADFHGHLGVQVPRYFITMAPSVLYFTVLGWQLLIDHAREHPPAITEPARGLVPGILKTLLVVTLLVGVVARVVTTPTEPDRYVAAARESADWLTRTDPAYAEETIYSDVWPLTSWYLQTNVRPMPSFEETRAFAHELDKSTAGYFFTLRGRRFGAYNEVRTDGPLTVLQRTSQVPVPLPRIAYLGSSWDNYLENTTDYSFYLDSTAGRYGFEGTAFLDALSAEEMRGYDAISAAGFKWRSHADCENALREYVEDGGVVVIDASQNLGGLAYSVADTIMLDTVIRRQSVDADAQIGVAPAFAAAHPEIGAVNAEEFIDETGGQWRGAVYEARPGLPALRTLATLNGKPAIQVQALGEGRIYWIGYNLVW